jgi:hypothetical protein
MRMMVTGKLRLGVSSSSSSSTSSAAGATCWTSSPVESAVWPSTAATVPSPSSLAPPSVVFLRRWSFCRQPPLTDSLSTTVPSGPTKAPAAPAEDDDFEPDRLNGLARRMLSVIPSGYRVDWLGRSSNCEMWH